MDDGPYWVILLMYESHDMRHTGFRRLTVVNGTLGFWGVTLSLSIIHFSVLSFHSLFLCIKRFKFSFNFSTHEYISKKRILQNLYCHFTLHYTFYNIDLLF